MSILHVFFNKEAGARHVCMAIMNILGMIYFLVVNAAVVGLSLFEIVPAMYGYSAQIVFSHYGFLLFVFLNVAGNFSRILVTDSSIKTLTKEEMRKTEKYSTETCSKCEIKIPPRCHHCFLCDTCVLKRDHHCFFTCVCIGYHNQKYFIMMCFYVMLGGLYGAIMMVAYLHHLYGFRFNGVLNIITLLPETLTEFLWIGTASGYKLLIVIVFYISFIPGLVGSGFWMQQTILVYYGQTTHEASIGDEQYSRSAWRNFLDVFGKYWYLTLFLPLPLPQQGSGLYIKQQKVAAGDKNTPNKRNGKGSQNRKKVRVKKE